MATAVQTLPDPVERFNALCAALHPGDHVLESTWMRFAAYAALLVPGQPETVARNIRAKAELLHRHTGWYSALSSPLRFAVAASLVESDCMIHRFEGHMAKLKTLLSAERLHPGDGVLAVLSAIHAILGDGHQVSPLRIARVALLEREARPHAWWKIGCEDLPVCLALSYLDGTARDLTSAADRIQARLAELGVGDAHARRAASRFVLLGEGGAASCAPRLEALIAAYRKRFQVVGNVTCEVLASLSSLDHEPQAVLDAWADAGSRLQALEPPLRQEAREVLAGDLAFLRLVRTEPSGAAAGSAPQHAALFSRLRRHYAISLILACDAMSEVPALSAIEQQHPFPPLMTVP